MQLHIGDKHGQNHFTLGHVLFPCLRAICMQDVVFPAFIMGVMLMVRPDMLNQAAVAVPQILPPLVGDKLPLQGIGNRK